MKGVYLGRSNGWSDFSNLGDTPFANRVAPLNTGIGDFTQGRQFDPAPY